MGTFFAAALLHGHAPEPREFFGTAFWIGFTLQAMAAEIWINYTRPANPRSSRIRRWLIGRRRPVQCACQSA